MIAAKAGPITARGYVSIAAQYRLSGAAKWPSQIEDARTHVRWVREHASQLGIDPKRSDQMARPRRACAFRAPCADS